MDRRHADDVKLVADGFLQVGRLVIRMPELQCDGVAKQGAAGQRQFEITGKIGSDGRDRHAINDADFDIFDRGLASGIGVFLNNRAAQRNRFAEMDDRGYQDRYDDNAENYEDGGQGFGSAITRHRASPLSMLANYGGRVSSGSL
jgi:hypothetical protein